MHTVEVNGTVTGGLWWPIGEPAQMAVSEVTEDDGAVTLRDIIGAIVENNGRDFSTAPMLTADTYVTIRHERPGTLFANGHRTATIRSRTYAATDLPSIADYVDGEAWTYGEWEDAEWSAAVGVR